MACPLGIDAGQRPKRASDTAGQVRFPYVTRGESGVDGLPSRNRRGAKIVMSS